jgi:hypothetical protein
MARRKIPAIRLDWLALSGTALSFGSFTWAGKEKDLRVKAFGPVCARSGVVGRARASVRHRDRVHFLLLAHCMRTAHAIGEADPMGERQRHEQKEKNQRTA